ncbi:hypothetical protein KIL84_006784 [Mauremys mutica]|uniref:Uncharacterized protein n=1 Tax=Mauremys mutica TaxID=74926 RepID=A0A9D4AWD0_9SAUR|nr:hypothetical protein KIL84_006784 [Mauremys mutica]
MQEKVIFRNLEPAEYKQSKDQIHTGVIANKQVIYQTVYGTIEASMGQKTSLALSKTRGVNPNLKLYKGTGCISVSAQQSKLLLPGFAKQTNKQTLEMLGYFVTDC